MEEKEVDLRDYINMVRKRWKIILIIFLVFTITSGVVSFLLPRAYESTAMVKIGIMRSKLLEEPSTTIEIFKTGPVLEEVAKELNVLTTQEKLGQLASKIKMKEKSGFLEIKGRGETPEEALKLVNGVTTVLLNRHEQIFERAKVILEEYFASGKKRLFEIEKEINMLQKKIDELVAANSDAKAMLARGYMDSLEKGRDRYERLQVELREKKMEESYGTVSTELVIPPATPDRPIGPKKKQNILIAGILGLFVGFVSAAVVEYFKKPATVH
ncbi:MAG TPA: Wzz/FepE/Etk N-terminal domain-containing protein [bacterium]|nr:Wzz/FepE/Etk N-terminal domain-containing protein [bacterium]